MGDLSRNTMPCYFRANSDGTVSLIVCPDDHNQNAVISLVVEHGVNEVARERGNYLAIKFNSGGDIERYRRETANLINHPAEDVGPNDA